METFWIVIGIVIAFFIFREIAIATFWKKDYKFLKLNQKLNRNGFSALSKEEFQLAHEIARDKVAKDSGLNINTYEEAQKYEGLIEDLYEQALYNAALGIIVTRDLR